MRSAACGVSAAYQSLDHPAAEDAVHTDDRFVPRLEQVDEQVARVRGRVGGRGELAVDSPGVGGAGAPGVGAGDDDVAGKHEIRRAGPERVLFNVTGGTKVLTAAAVFALYQRDVTLRPLELLLAKEAKPFTHELVSGVDAHLAELDEPSAGIPGREISFYSDSELLGAEVTNAAGVAEVAVPPGHRGANRTYKAVFAGDDFYAASSDIRPGRGSQEGSESTAPAAHSYNGVFPR